MRARALAVLLLIVVAAALLEPARSSSSPSQCSAESDTSFRCTWDASFKVGEYPWRTWELPAGLGAAIVDIDLATNDAVRYVWGFCIESGDADNLSCPISVTEDPTGSVSSHIQRTVLVDFDRTKVYHFHVFPNAQDQEHTMQLGGFMHNVAPADFHIEGRFHLIARRVPSGEAAGSPMDPQLRGAVGDAARLGSDISGGWMNEPYLDDALIEVGIVVPDLRELSPAVRERDLYDLRFDLLGHTYDVRWTYTGNSNAHDDGWATTEFEPAKGPTAQVISLPHLVDPLNGTLATLVPLKLIGDPQPGDLFTKLVATSSHAVDVEPAPAATTDDTADTMARPFTIGGPAVWDRLRDASSSSAPAAAPATWLAAPLAPGHARLTFGLAALAVVAGGSAVAVARWRRGASAAILTPGVVAPGALVLGRYHVTRELGAGANGRAFLAEDRRDRRAVVLKSIGGDVAAAMREASAARAVEHPHVVRVLAVEEVPTGALLVMEYVDGGSLKERIAASGPLSDAAFAKLAHDLLSAVDAVHRAGGVHRDIKPANVLLTKDGRAKLSDFGTARLPGFEATMGGAVVGSVRYMSPEQARGRRVGPASDLYSAAATLYEARTGRPFVEALPDESASEMQARVGAGLPAPDDVEPPALRAWFARALAPSPEARFASAADMLASLPG